MEQYQYRPGPKRNTFKEIFFGKNALSRLILINIVVFAVISLAKLGNFLFLDLSKPVIEQPLSELAQWLAVPSSLKILLYRPWTLLSYMFTHEGILHILFNMIMLYFGGRIFMEYLGGKRLVLTYLFGGLMGAVFYIAAYNLFPVFSSVLDQSVALGASASVMAILVAVATYAPNYKVNMIFLGSMKLVYLVLIFLAVDLLTIERSNPGGHISHLGGAFWGFLYVVLMKRGKNFGGFWVPIGNFFKRLFRPKPKMRVHYSQRPMTDDEYNTRKVEHQKKIDAILDKISKSGYESLSHEEKDLLFRSSKKEF